MDRASPTDFSKADALWFGEIAEDAERKAAAASLAATIAQVHGVRPMPKSVRRLIEVTSDENFAVSEVSKLIQTDASLSARVLQFVNSAAFALPVGCKSIDHAVVLLGPRKIRDIAITAAAFNMLVTPSLWGNKLAEHAMFVATIARRMAKSVKVSADDAFMCGLMHDLGKLMLHETGATDYPWLLEEFGSAPDVMHLREKERYGFDHAILGSHVLASWRVPEPVPFVVRYHHAHERAQEAPPETKALLQLVRLSDHIAYQIHDEKPDDAWFAQLAGDVSATTLRVSEESVRDLWSEMRDACLSSRKG